MNLAAIDVEWGKLLEAALVSAAFGIGVVVVAGFAVIASLRAQDRRHANEGGAIVFDVATAVCVLAVASSIALGIYIMIQK